MPTPSPDPIPDNLRCQRNGGRSWRCPFRRLADNKYCKKHDLYSVSKRKPQNPNSISRVSESEADDSRSGESRVGISEIWAFPDESDGSRCIYARIDLLIPSRSLIQATPLIPNQISPSCGSFRVSGEMTEMPLSSAAFLVNAEPVADGYNIFPMKGEVWAMYAGKSSSELKFVEIVSGFSEEDGVGIVALEGDTSVYYRRQMFEGFYMARTITKDCLAVFSHRVAAVRIVQNGKRLWKKKFLASIN